LGPPHLIADHSHRFYLGIFGKAQIQAKFHKIPVMRFEDQKLTSFSGMG
jgi:hypothetical protein